MSYSRRVAAFTEFAWKASVYARRLPADVVFASSTPLTIAIPAVNSKAFRAPMVLEVRDLWPEMPIAMGALRSKASITAAQLLEKWAYKNSDHIIALSPGMADGIAATGYPKDRITVIPNASDVDMFQHHDDGQLLFNLEPALRGRQIVLFAGSMGPLYEPAKLVELARHLSSIDASLALVMIGDGKCKGEAISEARRHGALGRSVFILDPMSRADVVSAFAACRVVLSVAAQVPGIEHNSANKFFDGLAAARPVAVNYGGWQAQMLREAGAGINASRDPSEAARQLADIALMAQDDWYRMGQRALALAVSHFERSRLNSQIQLVIESTATGSAPI